ncbi:hypothetical protein EGW08_014459 [Elysia chlorotica]|uniref:Receptor ligand binding region domain-containing protein n=1 Tax=Elysia chlorotica TaxID=188477 RepID=A0A3S1BXZ2_ELYCH|nr:hypothetical protein EGW08_014459 [Elysia chlorotica]
MDMVRGVSRSNPSADGKDRSILRNSLDTLKDFAPNSENPISVPFRTALIELYSTREKRDVGRKTNTKTSTKSTLETSATTAKTTTNIVAQAATTSTLLAISTRTTCASVIPTSPLKTATSSDSLVEIASTKLKEIQPDISTTPSIPPTATTSISEPQSNPGPLHYISRRSADDALGRIHALSSSNKTTQPAPPLSTLSTTPTPSFRLVLLLPKSNDYEFNSNIISVAVEIALDYLNASSKTSGFRLLLEYGDSQCSEIMGPIRAFEYFCQGLVDAFLGPVCDFSVAPVARYSAYWKIPVITAGALSHDFQKFKLTQYRTLTRVGPSTVGVATLLTRAIRRQGWKRLLIVYDPHAVINTIPSLCYLTASAVASQAKEMRLEPTSAFLDQPDKVLRMDVGLDRAGE